MGKVNKHRMTRWLGVAASAGLLTMAMGLPAAQAAQKKPVVIGVLTSLTGKNGVQGTDIKRGVELAVERINQGYKVPMLDGSRKKFGPGVLDGRKIKIVVADTESRPKSAMDAVRKLVNVDNVPVVLGGYSSGLTVPTGKWTNDNGVIQIGIGSTSPQLRKIKPYFFNAIGTDFLMGEKLAVFAMKDSGAKTFTSIVPNNPFGVGVEVNSCPKIKSMGGKCINKVRYEAQKSDYRPTIRSAFQGNPQAGLFTAYGTEARLILKQMYEMGKVPPKGWYADYPSMWANEASKIPKVADGIKGLRPGPRADNGFYDSEYATAYKKKYGESPTTAFGAYGYDAAMLTALAIDKAQSTDPNKLKKTLYTVAKTYKGITGSKAFDKNGMQKNEVYHPVIFKDGKLQPYHGH